MDNDLALALQLQDQFDQESQSAIIQPSQSSRGQTSVSLADASWELIDPNPDIRTLFLQFNDRFFWGRLSGIEVKWSPRMTLCAGLCVYEGRGGLCSVRLSLPLLKLRPRKDLVETLLHEMIHAYLFVTDNNKDHDGHGPEFHKHMYRINEEAGVNITVYHSFHDEVAEYRQHWWRCSGPCQNRKPFFGYVKRAMNRAPGPNDNWWNDHKNSCNGTFVKIKEPENYGKKKKKDKEKQSKTENDKNKESEKKGKNMDIRVFIGKGHVLSGNSSKSEETTNSVSQPSSALSFSDDDSSDSFEQFLQTMDNDNFSNDELPVDSKGRAGSPIPSTSGTSKEPPYPIDISAHHNDNDIGRTQNKSVKNESSSDSFSSKFVVLSDSDDEMISEVSDRLMGRNSDSDFKESPSLKNSSFNTSQQEPGKPDNDVQLKLREIWGAKFSNHVNKGNKNLVRGKRADVKSVPGFKVNDDSSKKRPLDLGEYLSASKRKKTEDSNLSCDKQSDISVIGVTDSAVGRVTSPDDSNRIETNTQNRSEMCSCPVCSQQVPVSQINQHLDNCLGVT